MRSRVFGALTVLVAGLLGGCSDSAAGDVPQADTVSGGGDASDSSVDGTDGGDAAEGDTVTADTNATESGDVPEGDADGVDGSDSGDTTELPTQCTPWEGNLEASNRTSVREFGFRHSTAVVVGTMGETVMVGDQPYAPLLIESVTYGWTFLVGAKGLVPLAPGLTVPPGTRWAVGVSQSHPVPWEQHPTMYFGNVVTMAPLEDTQKLSESMGYRAHGTAVVAVVRVSAQDEYRTTFEVVETLRGEPPASFQDNWYADWGLTYPAKSDELFIASANGVWEVPGGDQVGSVIDWRPATEAYLAEVKAAIAADDEEAKKAALKASHEALVRSYRFQRARFVVSAVVTGLADECCTGAGGTYVGYEAKEVLRGEEVPKDFILGGHAYYGPERCGDALLLGLDAFGDGPTAGEPFTCNEPAFVPSLESAWGHARLEATADNRVTVGHWVDAPPPLFQLYAVDEPVGPENVAQTAADLPWSPRFDAAEAFHMSTEIILLTVDKVTSKEGHYHEVLFTTTYSRYEYEHLEKHQVKLAFSCGDDRLLTVGSRWVAPMLRLEAVTYQPGEPPDPSRGFLIPGVLLPESEMTDQLANYLVQYLHI